MKHKTPNYRFNGWAWEPVPLRQDRKDLAPEDLARDVLGVRHDENMRTELFRRGSEFVVESIGDGYRSKNTFSTDRDAFEFFNEDSL